MYQDIKSIKYIPKNIIKKLENIGIHNLNYFIEKAATPELRIKLAREIGADEKDVYFWVKQADLLKIEGINPDDAYLLAKVGLRSAEDLSIVNTDELECLIYNYAKSNPETTLRTIPASILNKWKESSKSVGKRLVLADNDKLSEALTKPVSTGTNQTSDDILNISDLAENMSSLIVNMGKSLAAAQRALDASAIETQKMINDDEELRNSGIMATWYTIPETTFNLKMHYDVVKEVDKNNNVIGNKILVNPINARYQNYFKVEASSQSEVNLRFVPIPPPTKISQIIYFPDLIGKTIEEAKETIKQAGLSILDSNIIFEQGATAEGKATEVIKQLPEAGSEVRYSDKVTIWVKRN